MHRRALRIAVAFLTLISLCLPARAATPVTPDTLTDEQVVAAMRKGIDYLLKEKKTDNWEQDRRWNANTTQKTGPTALAFYSLIIAGQSLNDDNLTIRSAEVAPVVKYLMNTVPEDIYGTSLHAIAISLMPQNKDTKKVLERDRDFLIAAMNEDGIGYTYHYDKAEAYINSSNRRPVGVSPTLKIFDRADHSNTQFATLAMWAIEDAGVEIPTAYWKNIEKYWRARQEADGGWFYHGGGDLCTLTMTPAGTASMFILLDVSSLPVSTKPLADKTIDQALANINTSFDPSMESYYYLYGIERVGRATGLKSFGGKAWYRSVAANLIGWQKPDGFWADSYYNGEGRFSTPFALLTLARGRNPVLFNKLQYHDPTWAARPRDNANITEYTAKNLERPINWQIVNLDSPPQEWTDAPVLLFTGSIDPKFTADDIAKFRSFINAGGMIFSTPDGGSEIFTVAMKKYAQQVFAGQYEMKLLPATHPIFNLWGTVKNPPQMFGLNNGIRELWIHSAVDMGASWQGRRYATKDHFSIPVGIYFYVTGKDQLRPRLKPLATVAAANPPAATRTLAMARIRYASNFDPEPGAWPRLAVLAREHAKIDLAVTETPLANLDPAKTPLAHLTGTATVTFTDADRATLKAFIENGGTLFIDAAGGSPAFAASALKLIADLEPNAAPAPLDRSHPIYTSAAPEGYKIETPGLRTYALLNRGKASQILAVSLKGRPAILYSDLDITSGLLGTNTWGIAGYTPVTSEQLATNLVLWIADGSKPPATNKSPTSAPATSPATVPAK